MAEVAAGVSILWKARLAVLAGGVSLAALTVGLATHDLLAYAAASAAGMVAVGSACLEFVERSSRSGALARLHEAIEPMAEGIAFFDAEDRAVVWNSRYAELVDPAGALAVGRTFSELLESNLKAGAHPDAAGREAAWLVERLATRDRLGSDEHRNGDHWVRAERRRTRDGGLVTVCTDVTDFRRATEVLAEARDAAEAANRTKSEFLANVSHELRTPLNGVLGIAEVLTTTSLDQSQREMVETIRASAVKLDELVSDVIDLARLESGKVAAEVESFDLTESVGAACAPYRLQASRKGIRFIVDIPAVISGRVRGDAMRLRQILGNLLSNAVKFTDVGEVVLAVSRPDRTGDILRFTVTDSGIGFDDAFKERIFERFQQADGPSPRRHGGTGLGLAISKQAARLLDGDLNCESAPGLGSVFTLTLSLPPAAAVQPATAAPAQAYPAPAESSPALKVLVVDDHPTNRRVVEMILDQVGAERVSVENGQEALEAFLSEHFDVVLMDIQMPVMDGLTATRSIRLIEKQSSRPSTPVIILSANALPEHIAAGKAAGADRHLGKPISAAALLGAIAEVAVGHA